MTNTARVGVGIRGDSMSVVIQADPGSTPKVQRIKPTGGGNLADLSDHLGQLSVFPGSIHIALADPAQAPQWGPTIAVQDDNVPVVMRDYVECEFDGIPDAVRSGQVFPSVETSEAKRPGPVSDGIHSGWVLYLRKDGSDKGLAIWLNAKTGEVDEIETGEYRGLWAGIPSQGEQWLALRYARGFAFELFRRERGLVGVLLGGEFADEDWGALKRVKPSFTRGITGPELNYPIRHLDSLAAAFGALLAR